jgi:hypothetical protein
LSCSSAGGVQLHPSKSYDPSEDIGRAGQLSEQRGDGEDHHDHHQIFTQALLSALASEIIVLRSGDAVERALRLHPNFDHEMARMARAATKAVAQDEDTTSHIALEPGRNMQSCIPLQDPLLALPQMPFTTYSHCPPITRNIAMQRSFLLTRNSNLSPQWQTLASHSRLNSTSTMRPGTATTALQLFQPTP